MSRFHDLVASDDADSARHAVLDCLLARLEQVAARVGCSTTDLASTFLAVGLTSEQFVVLHIGDGVIGYQKHDELRVVSAPDNTEFANQTTFVTSLGAAASMRLFRGSLHNVAGFVLMSDGTSASLYDYRASRLAPACAKLIRLVGSAPTRSASNPAHKREVRRLLDTKVRDATKDDCSIGILARR